MKLNLTVMNEVRSARQSQPSLKPGRVFVTFGLIVTVLLTACSGLPFGLSAQSSGNNGQGRPGFRITPAPELPSAQADVTGIFVRRQDASIFVGTFGNGQGQGNFRRTPGATRQAPQDATPQPYTGPTTEIVTNASTRFYKDVTQMNFQQGQQDQGIQEQVQSVDSLDSLITADETGGQVSAWGDKNGDQLIAKVVLYRPRTGRQQQPNNQGG